ncbi:MAG: hypothetical protein R3B74_07290 [Nitrospirales bacterium]|nr:hypothetical protein [Nitrospirales bacterium]
MDVTLFGYSWGFVKAQYWQFPVSFDSNKALNLQRIDVLSFKFDETRGQAINQKERPMDKEQPGINRRGFVKKSLALGLAGLMHPQILFADQTSDQTGYVNLPFERGGGHWWRFLKSGRSW